MKKNKGFLPSVLLFFSSAAAMTSLCSAVFMTAPAGKGAAGVLSGIAQAASGAAGTAGAAGAAAVSTARAAIKARSFTGLFSAAAWVFPFAASIRGGSVFTDTLSYNIREGLALIVLGCLLAVLCSFWHWFRHLPVIVNAILWIFQVSFAVILTVLAGLGLAWLQEAVPYGSALVTILCALICAAVIVISGSRFFIGLLLAGVYVFLSAMLLYAGVKPGPALPAAGWLIGYAVLMAAGFGCHYWGKGA